MASQWLHLRFSYFGQIDFLSRYEISLIPSRKISQVLGACIDEALMFGPDRSDVAAWILRYEVALKILRVLDASCPAKPKPPEQVRFEKVFIHIRENWGQPLSVQQLARVAGLSPAQFHVLFKKAMGSSPMTYVRKMRLEAASRQLVASDATLTQIAEANGFADAFHFSHCFKAHFGIGPRGYRRRYLDSTL